MPAPLRVSTLAAALLSTAGPASANDSPQAAALMQMNDRSLTGMLLIDRLENEIAPDTASLAWNADGWYGGDYDKLWVKSEGERRSGVTEARTEALWDRALTRWWNLQLGLRHDALVGPDRNWLGFGLQGLAPEFYVVEATAYIGDGGRTAARLSAERDLLLTQRLILQPEFEINLYGRPDRENQVRSGVSDAELALRLRYEFRREFACYLGVGWQRYFGESTAYAHVPQGHSDSVELLAGLRVWM